MMQMLPVLKKFIWRWDLRISGYSGVGLMVFAKLVRFQFQLDPYDKNTLFLFCGRKCDRIKALLWEGDGFLLMYKKTRQWCIPMATLCGRGNGHHRRTVPHADAGSGD